MDFKFKEVVEESIIYFYDHVLSSNEYTDDVLEELDHVYTQAAKADEYEAKAELADDIITAWKTGNFDFTEGEGSLPDHGIAPVPNYHMFDFGQYVDSLLDEYESGEKEC